MTTQDTFEEIAELTLMIHSQQPHTLGSSRNCSICNRLNKLISELGLQRRLDNLREDFEASH